MNAVDDERPPRYVPPPDRQWPVRGVGRWGLVFLGLALVVTLYNACKIDVGTGQQAVLIRKEGLELEPDMELAPPPKDGRSYYKGVQSGGANNGVLTEGRYFYNPYLLVVGDQPAVRRAQRQDRHPDRPLRRRHARRSRSWPSRARRGSCARS